MKNLIKVTETYRVDTVDEVKSLHEEFQNDNTYTLTSYSYTTKYEKEKGEIVGEYQVVTAKKEFDDVKAPCRDITINYEEE